MRRETLERLVRREGLGLVRALDVASGEEKLIQPGADPSPLGQAATAAAAADAGRRVTLDGRTWFLSVYRAPWEMVIVGAVHIAQALATLATAAGYRVRVIDPRAPYASADRFAGVALDRRWPDEALTAHPLTERSVLIALAHDPKLDDPALAAALRSPAPYIGALGSARTHAKRLARLSALGFSRAALAKIHGPVGLPIGARSPSEIAIAILAELVRVRRSPPRPKIAGVILAAGQSRRMGRNKLVAELNGKALVRHVAEAALSSGLDPVLVVTGHEAAALRPLLAGLDVGFVHNSAFAAGMSTSLRAGIGAVPPDCDGAMILLADMPGVTAGLIDRLITGFRPGTIAMPAVAGRRGHPVLWARKFFDEFAGLEGDAGARALLARHEDDIREIETEDDAPLRDIDTPEALAAWR